MKVAKRLIEACPIRRDVLETERGISALAVDLDGIVAADTETAYDDPAEFFRMTYPTHALITIATQVFRRITGQDREAQGIYLLGTALGGGKSHILASLYHLACNGSSVLTEDFAKRLGGIDFAPIRVAVLTQDSPAGGKKAPRTLWGHLAAQLNAYDSLKEYDEELQAPPKESLLALLSGVPVLILMDEITNYLIRAAAVAVGGRTLAEQTRVFLQILEEVVDLRTNAALVISQLPEEFDPLDEGAVLDKVTKGLRGAEKEEVKDRAHREVGVVARLLMRKAETQTPVRDDIELVNILRRRIFESIDNEVADAAARTYADYYRSPGPRGVLPTTATGPEAKDRISTNYPFHPRTVSLLRDKLGQAPKFMQTRGALLLAIQAVRRLRETESKTMLVHPTHLDPRDATIRQEIAKRVFDDERVENAIHTEIVGKGEEARAALVDATFKSDLGSRITTAILLESALVTTKGEKDPLVGATHAEILYDVLEPGEDETRAEQALQAVRETSFHIVPVGEKLVFRGEVNLNKFIEERARAIRSYRIDEEVQRLLRSRVLRGASIFDLVWWPTSPEEIADKPKLRLAVMPPSDPWWLEKGGVTRELENMFRNKNQAGESRLWRNAVAFLVPSAEQRERVEEKVRRFLAVQEISSDTEFVESLSDDQKKSLEQELTKSKAIAILRVGMAYNMLLYPGVAGKYEKPKLIEATLRLTETDVGVDSERWTIGKSRVLSVLGDRLADEDKLRTDPYSPDYFVQKIFTSRGKKAAPTMTYGEIENAFFRDPRLPFIETKDLVRNTVKTGVDEGTWLVLSGERLFTSKASRDLVLHEDSEVIRYKTGRWSEVSKLFCLKCGSKQEECTCVIVEPPPEERCPDCGNLIESCTCGGSFTNVILDHIPDKAAEWAKKRGTKIRQVTVMVNKPGDVAFILRLIGSLSGRGTTAEIGDLRLSIPSAGDVTTDTLIRSERPGPLWSILRSSVEGLLAQVTSGKAQGKGNVNLIVSFKEPLGAEEVRTALTPLTMAGSKNIKAVRVMLRPEVGS